MTSCVEFFERLDQECEAAKTGRIRGDRLRAAERLQRLVEWENEIASRLSPGPIGNHETIRKALYQGQEIVEGEIHANTFASLRDGGLSADRTAYSAPTDSQARFAKRSTATKPLYGFIDISVSHLREIQRKDTQKEGAEETRAIAVYDTAFDENTAHAEAFMLVKYSTDRPLKSLQADLMDKYKGQIGRYDGP
jgi:hypothetical protein